jgi:hypothetical protein
MSQFDCENPRVAEILEEMKVLVESNGGKLDDSLRIVQQGPSLSISSTATEDPKRALIDIPEACLVPYDSLDVAVEGEKPILRSTLDGITPLQTKLAGLMFEVFNLTNKLSDHRSTHPLFCFLEEPAVIELLAQARPVIQGLLKTIQDVSLDAALVTSFFKTRTLSFGGNADNAGLRVVMPFIDYANHNSKSPGFKTQHDDGQSGIALMHSAPVIHSNECFVSYSRKYELTDMYLGYGFLERGGRRPFLRSVPLELEIPDFGEIHVDAETSNPYEGKLGPENQKLRYWLPQIRERKDDNLRVSHLLIPTLESQSPHALKRTLIFLLRSLGFNSTKEALIDAVKSAGSHIISSNVSFYEQLKQAAENPQSANTSQAALSDLILLCDLQLEELCSYSLEET